MSHSDYIINTLLDEPEKTLSGGEFAKRLGVSRTAVWKRVKALQKEGYEIEVLKGKGYRLNKLTSKPVEREITRGLLTKKFGQRVVYHDEVDSTNEIAKELARKGEKEGALVIASEQSKGKGRLDRVWESPKGGVFMSLILNPDIHPKAASKLTLLSGLAVIRAIKSLYDLDAKLKWPNDIILNDKKLGGVLSEMEGEAERVNFVVVGIGIDANCEVSVDMPTTSLKEEIGREVDIIQLVRETLKQFEVLYNEFIVGSSEFLEDYKKNSHTLGRDVKIMQPKGSIIGKAVDVDEDGALVIRLGDGSYETVLSGDCVYLR
jgi:BirA family biotin operon repressor/biotin-[acetyl-CoA-carboxylase] ligase